MQFRVDAPEAEVRPPCCQSFSVPGGGRSREVSSRFSWLLSASPVKGGSAGTSEMSTMFADTLLIVFISVCTALLAEGEVVVSWIFD